MHSWRQLVGATVLVAVAIAASAADEDVPYCEDTCADGEEYVDVLGEGRCVKLLDLGAACTPLNESSTAICARGTRCRRGVCSKVFKGGLCSDDPALCEDGFACRPVAKSDVGPSPLRTCQKVNVPLGGRCSSGRRSDFSYFQRDLTDECAEGLHCVLGRCAASPEDGSNRGSGKAGDNCATWKDCSAQAPRCVEKPSTKQMVCMTTAYYIGDNCDLEQNQACDTSSIIRRTGPRLLPREVEGKCVDGVCVSAAPDYPYEVKCDGDKECKGGLVCGDKDRCVEPPDETLPPRSPPVPSEGQKCKGRCVDGFLCVKGVCVSESKYQGVGPNGECNDGKTCMAPLKCKELESMPKKGPELTDPRCAQEALLPGVYCRLFPDYMAWTRLNWLQCVPGVVCTRMESLFRSEVQRCMKYVKSGEKCGFYEGFLCENERACVYGTCE